MPSQSYTNAFLFFISILSQQEVREIKIYLFILWLEVTTFCCGRRSQHLRGFLQPDVGTVRCSLWPQSTA